MAKLYLDRHPDAFETVQRLLGHKSRETTMRFYRELDAILAGKRSPRPYYDVGPSRSVGPYHLPGCLSLVGGAPFDP